MPRQTVKLVSAEGHEFIIDYKAACVSNTIRNMLSSQGTGLLSGLGIGFGFLCRTCLTVRPVVNTGSFTETELGEVKFPEISTPILEKVCQYFYYKLKYQNS
jgi:transcription elongation factor B subunit 1